MMEFGKVYIRSLTAIITVGTVLCYGMYLGEVAENVQLAALSVVAVCVLFDKPKPEDM